jgi:hypothetical protein
MMEDPAFREEMQRLTSSDTFKSAMDRVSSDIEVTTVMNGNEDVE